MKFLVEGNLPRKSNGRRIKFYGGRMASIKSANALAYEQSFYYQIANQKPAEPMTGDLVLMAIIFYQSNRSDLSDELLADLCEKSGIIINDRQFKEKHLYHRIDKKWPRVEFKIEQISPTLATPRLLDPLRPLNRPE